MSEEWRIIPEHPGYKVSNQGRVVNSITGVIRKLSNDGAGYKNISLNRKTKRVHRLVMLSFSPLEDASKYQVNHLNRDRSDNRLTNLEWCTSSENLKHAFRNGRKASYKVKLSDSEVMEIRGMLSKGNTQQKVADFFGISRSHVSTLWLRNSRRNI